MKTILFLLQKSQFSAVIGNERCRFHGEESMSLSEYDSEKIVEYFENNDDFKGWNDTKLFILYDIESAKYLFNIIDGFELKNKVGQCKNFSFQIKLEEKPIDLKGDVSSFVKYLEQGDVAALAEIDQLKEEINNLKNKIKAKDETIKEINDTIKKLESANSETISELNKQVEQQKEFLKENLDPYSKLNFIDRGDYIELARPIGNIKKIEKASKKVGTDSQEKVREYVEKLALDGGGWRLPTYEEVEIINKINDVLGIRNKELWTSEDLDDASHNLYAGLLRAIDKGMGKLHYICCVK